MICPICGATVDNGAQFCPNCGTVFASAAAPQQPQQYQQQQYPYQQPQQQQYPYQQYQQQQYPYQQPQQYPYQQPNTLNNQAPAVGMKWFKFLIYFGLFAGAVMNALSAVTFLTGSMYGVNPNMVYAVFGDLKTLDMLVGILLLAVAALGIFTRFRLSGYRKNGPAMLNVTYLAAVVTQVIYIIGVLSILPEEAFQYLNFTSVGASIAVSVVMVFVNTAYFKKRKYLFVK